MNLDKFTKSQLKKYAQVFKEAQERDLNESDTVMYLIKFFEDVLGYNSLSGEISKEVSIKDRYCDFGVKLNGEYKFLVEAKAAGNKTLRAKDIEQAENYGSRSGIRWVLLTNGIEWQLYNLSFNETDGITHDLLFNLNLPDNIDTDINAIWNCLGLLEKNNVLNDSLEDFLNHKKALSPQSLIRTLFTEDVLTVIRRELNRSGEVRLDFEDIIASIKDVLSKDAIMAAGDIGFKKSKKRKKKSKSNNNVNSEELNDISGCGEEREELTDKINETVNIEKQKSNELLNYNI